MSFIIKKYQEHKPAKRIVTSASKPIKEVPSMQIKEVEEKPKEVEVKPIVTETPNNVQKNVEQKKKEINKNEAKTKDMDKISMAEQIINDTPRDIKRLKKDKGLIERTESSKTILTEDNKQLLVD